MKDLPKHPGVLRNERFVYPFTRNESFNLEACFVEDLLHVGGWMEGAVHAVAFGDIAAGDELAFGVGVGFFFGQFFYECFAVGGQQDDAFRFYDAAEFAAPGVLVFRGEVGEDGDAVDKGEMVIGEMQRWIDIIF